MQSYRGEKYKQFLGENAPRPPTITYDFLSPTTMSHLSILSIVIWFLDPPPSPMTNSYTKGLELCYHIGMKINQGEMLIILTDVLFL
jgi:hypothetical protein